MTVCFQKRSKMRIVVGLVGFVLVFIGIIGGTACTIRALEVGRDIGAPLNRAQVAAQPEDMDIFMEQVQEGMEKHSYISGYSRPYNQNIDSNFAVQYQAVVSIRERLAIAIEFNPYSIEYQTSIDDIRGIMRELDISQQEQNSWKFWWVTPVVILGLLVSIGRLFGTTIKRELDF